MKKICKDQDVEERLRQLEEKISDHYKWIVQIKIEIAKLREQKPFSQKEFHEQKKEIAFKEMQLDEVQSFLNYLEAKAHSITRIIGHS